MSKLPNYHGCFVCGDHNPSGLNVRFHTEDEHVWTTYTPDAQHTGYKGITHGGIIAALLDETMGWAPTLTNRRFCVTAELTIQYLKPAKEGVELRVAGWVTADRRRIWETAGEITDSEGNLIARATGKYFPLSVEQTDNVVEYLSFDEGCVPPERVTLSRDKDGPAK